MCDKSISEEQSQRQSPRLYLLYHELQPSVSRYPYITQTGVFERHMELIVRLRQARGPSLWPEATFDDGHISNYEIAAPVLQSRGLTAHFFITVGWTGNKTGYMNWAELRSLQDSGNPVGAHGWTHALLTHCGDRELQTELNKSRLTLEDKLGTSITTMSLPGGRYNSRVLAACLKAGYSQVYTSVPKAEPIPLGTTVGRVNVLGNMQPEWIAELFEPQSRLLSRLGRQYRMKQTAKALLGDQVYGRLWALVNRRKPEEVDGGGKGNG